MATGGGELPPPPPSTPLLHRQSRWMGQEYADITKLREYAARHDRAATRAQQRAARVNTRIDKIRHHATVLREKAQARLAKIPEVEQQMQQHERDIKAMTERRGGAPVGSDVTKLQVLVRKLQQKVVDLQHSAHRLEHRAAQKTQKTAELKIKVDRFLETARLEEQEALAYRRRADHLQVASEAEAASRIAPAPPPEPNPSSAGPPKPR